MRAVEDRRKREPLAATHEAGRFIPAAHVFGLWAFAVAQPILDLVGREPDFLVAHRLHGAPLAILALGLSLGIPALLAAPLAIRSVHDSRIGRWYADGLRTLLAAAFFGQLLDLPLLANLPAAAILAPALVGGLGATLALHRWRGLSSLVAATALAALAAPVIFLLRPGVRVLLPPGDESELAPAIIQAPKFESNLPVVLIVFDELPTSSLQRPDGALNAERFPSFAALAAESNWYRHAATTGLQTTKAVPALLTGQLPRPASTASYRDHPANLFSWLATSGSYRIVAQQTVSRLCPPAVCTSSGDRDRWQDLSAAIDDLTVVYGHLLLPSALRSRLPDVSRRWTGFRERSAGPDAAGDRLAVPGPLHQEVPGLVDDFLRRIGRDGDHEPTFYYLHLNLPHRPWKYLPSGREYTPAGTEALPPGVGGGQLLEERKAFSAWQRHLLQVGYADLVLGQLLDRMRAVAIYDQALIVVTADHGHSFRPGQPNRDATVGNAEDVLEVPLFVKRPGQRDGAVYDHGTQTIDIVPTVAAAIGSPPPWRVDGKELNDTSQRTITVCCYQDGDAVRTFRPDPERRQQTLDRLEQLFGSFSNACNRTDAQATTGEDLLNASSLAPQMDDPFDGVFAAGPRPDLVDCPAAELSGANAEDGAAEPRRAILDAPDTFANVRPDSGFVPGLVSGRIEPNARDGTELAVAVDGFVRATTWTFTHRSATRFSALIHERWLPAGSHRIDVYAIESSRKAPDESEHTILRPLHRDAESPRLVLAGHRVNGLEIPGEGLLQSVDHLFRADVELVSGGIRGHLTYERDGRPSAVDEFFLFDGADLLYRGEDDRYRRRIARHEDGQEQTTFGIFLPKAVRERSASLRLLARKGDQVQELLLSARPPGRFELSWDDRGRVDALLRYPNDDDEPVRIPVPSSPAGLTGSLASRAGRTMGVSGWAADLANPGGAQEVVAFLQGRQLWISRTALERPDVASRHGQEHLYSGFRFSNGPPSTLQTAELDAVRREGIVVYVVSRRGVAARIPFSYMPIEPDRRRAEILPTTDGRRLTVTPPDDGFDGAVDLISRKGSRTVIQGWAGDLDQGQRPRQIVIYRDNEFLTQLGANQERSDVAEQYGDSRLLRTGFRGSVPGAPDPDTFADRHRVFAIMLRGAAVELPYLAQPVRPP